MDKGPWGSKELDTTERLTLSLSLVNIAARTFSEDWNPGLSSPKSTLFSTSCSLLQNVRERE